MNTRPREMD